ncbi:MAG: hypothetical protein ACRCZY_01585 [Phocaeicola sp.]
MRLNLLLLFVAITVSNCKTESNSDPNILPNGCLLSYSKTGTMSASEIKSTFSEIFPKVDTTEMINDIDYYKITYKSIRQGKSTVLSGLVLVPNHGTVELKQVQYHHGTLSPIPTGTHYGEDPTDAPSLFDYAKPIIEEDQYEVRAFGLSFASSGYFVSMPDYSGYGESSDKIHPYICTPTLAHESYEMILAARELAEKLGVSLSSDISLCGWSEGAATSLYTQKIIEEKKVFTVKVNSCLAGPYVPYNYINYVKLIPEDEVNATSFMLGWAILAHCFDQDIPLDNFFNSTITDFESFIEVCKEPTLVNCKKRSISSQPKRAYPATFEVGCCHCSGLMLQSYFFSPT